MPPPPPGANGVLQVPTAILQKGNHHQPTPPRAAQRAPKPGVKLVLRRLPPGFTQEQWETVLGERWRVGGTLVDWALFKKGKVSKDASKPVVPARAYIHLTDVAHVAAFQEMLRQTNFADPKNANKDLAPSGPPSLEKAPYARIPAGRRRKDQRQGLIDQDADFQEFLISLTNPPSKPQTPTATDGGVGEGAGKSKVTSTPLMDALRERKAAKDNKAHAVKAAKHARQESRDAGAVTRNGTRLDKGSEKKKSSGKGAPDGKAPSDKKSRPRGGDKAAKESGRQGKASESATNALTASQDLEAKATRTASSPKRQKTERRRDRGGIADILRRDLGLQPTGTDASRRAGRKEVAPSDVGSAVKAVKDIATAPASLEQSRDSDTSTSNAQSRTASRDHRPTRAERRANKTATGADTKDASGAGTARRPAKTPTILKKTNISTLASESSQPQIPAQSQTSPSKAEATDTPIPTSTPSSTTTTPKPKSTSSSTAQAFLKHANASQGITEPLLHAAMTAFGPVSKIEIDRRKGFAYVDFVDPAALRAAIAASPVKVAQGAVQVLERRDRPAKSGGGGNTAAGAANAGAGNTAGAAGRAAGGGQGKALSSSGGGGRGRGYRGRAEGKKGGNAEGQKAAAAQKPATTATATPAPVATAAGDGGG